MNKLLDLLLMTQLSTAFAFFCAIGAHLVASHANENWHFSVYVLLVLACGFMLAPYALTLNEQNRMQQDYLEEQAIAQQWREDYDPDQPW